MRARAATSKKFPDKWKHIEDMGLGDIRGHCKSLDPNRCNLIQLGQKSFDQLLQILEYGTGVSRFAKISDYSTDRFLLSYCSDSC